MAFRRHPLRYDLPPEMGEELIEERRHLREQTILRKNYISSFSNLTPDGRNILRPVNDSNARNIVSGFFNIF